MTRRALLAVLPLLLAGCGSSKPAAPVAAPSPTSAIKGCQVVLVDGGPVIRADIANGCTEPVNGSTIISGSFACQGGGELFQYGYSGGEFWGFVGKTWHKSPGKGADDAAYSKAYAACNG